MPRGEEKRLPTRRPQRAKSLAAKISDVPEKAIPKGKKEVSIKPVIEEVDLSPTTRSVKSQLTGAVSDQISGTVAYTAGNAVSRLVATLTGSSALGELAGTITQTLSQSLVSVTTGVFGSGLAKLKGILKTKSTLETIPKENPLTKIAAQASKIEKAVPAKSGGGIKMFLEDLSKGLETLGGNLAKKLKGTLVIGAMGVAIAGPFALALRLIKDVPPKTMLAFSVGIGLLGAEVALLGNMSSQILKGAIALAVLSPSLFLITKTISSIKSVDKSVIEGLLLAVGGLGVEAALLGNLSSLILRGGIALTAMSAAMVPFAFGLNLLKDIDLTSIKNAGIALTGLTIGVLGLGAILSSGIGTALFSAGVVGLLALGGSMLLFGAALATIKEIDLKSISAAGIALGGLTAAVFGLGALVSSGVGTALFGAGIAGLLLLGIAIYPLAKNLGKAGKGMAEFGDGISNLTEGIRTGLSLDHFSMIASGIKKINKALEEVDPEKLSLFSAIPNKIPKVVNTIPAEKEYLAVTAKKAKDKTIKTSAQQTEVRDAFTGGTSDFFAGGGMGTSAMQGKSEMLLQKMVFLLETYLNSPPTIAIDFGDETIRKVESKIKRAST